MKKQGSDIVQAYVLKRQQQLEHAQVLRTERKTGNSKQSMDNGDYNNPPPPTNQNYGGGMMAPPAPPTTINCAPSYDGGYHHYQQTSGGTYQRPPAQQPPPQPLRVTHTAPPPPSHVEVTEETFMGAVREGIVSMDQARQLWFMLSGRQPSVMSTPVMSRGPTSQGAYGGTQKYNPPPHPSTLSPPPVAPQTRTPELTHDTAYLRTENEKPSVKKAGGKPEWNMDTSAEPLDSVFPSRKKEDQKGENKEPSLSLLKQRQMERKNSKPEWNFDGPEARENNDVPVHGSARGGNGNMYEENKAPPPSVSKPKIQPKTQTTQQIRAPQRPTTPSSQPPPPPPPQQQHKYQYDDDDGSQGRPSNGVDVDSMAAIGSAQNKQMVANMLQQEAMEAMNEPQEECSICHRTFRVSTLDRHMTACAKSNKPRKVFDSSKMRTEDIEGLKEAKREQAAISKANTRAVPKDAIKAGQKIPKWQAQHEQLQAAMKAMKVIQHAEAMGLPPPPPAPTAHDDRVQCPHCDRKFAEDVAERHIPKCKNIMAKPKAPPRKR